MAPASIPNRHVGTGRGAAYPQSVIAACCRQHAAARGPDGVGNADDADLIQLHTCHCSNGRPAVKTSGFERGVPFLPSRPDWRVHPAI